MRGSPSCAVVVRRFVLWRWAVCIVVAASVVSLLAWLLLTPAGQSLAARIAVTFGGAAVLGLGASLLRMPAAALQWDGSSWTLRDLARPSAAPSAGQLDIALDLGAFLLLKFTSQRAAGRRETRWIPVERRGLEREWHSFRCAVYSPRPAAGPADAADPRPH
jgi:hypothetical protein